MTASSLKFSSVQWDYVLTYTANLSITSISFIFLSVSGQMNSKTGTFNLSRIFCHRRMYVKILMSAKSYKFLRNKFKPKFAQSLNHCIQLPDENHASNKRITFSNSCNTTLSNCYIVHIIITWMQPKSSLLIATVLHMCAVSHDIQWW